MLYAKNFKDVKERDNFLNAYILSKDIVSEDFKHWGPVTLFTESLST
jgi:hypothetical protein